MSMLYKSAMHMHDTHRERISHRVYAVSDLKFTFTYELEYELKSVSIKISTVFFQFQ